MNTAEQAVLKELSRRGIAFGGTVPEVAKATGLTVSQVRGAMFALEMSERVYATKRLRSGHKSWVPWIPLETK